MIKKITLSILIMVLAIVNSYGQFNATIAVKDAATNPVGGAQVTLGAQTVTSDATTGEATFTNLADGSYSYTVSKVCYVPFSGTVVVAGGNVTQTATLALQTSNQVAVSISGMIGGPQAGYTVTLSNGMSVVTEGGGLATFFPTPVPFGTYTYTITKTCRQTVTGTLVVDCAGGIESQINSDIPALQTTNNVFVSIGDFSPSASGFSINLTNGGSYNQTITSGNPIGDVFEAVPYDTYTYTITQNCYQTVTGTVTVNCNNGDGISVAIAEPAQIVINNSVTQAANVLTATATGVSYQWVNCDTANSPIDGATSQSYTATANGNYAVVLTHADCSVAVTSACINVSNLAVSSNTVDTFSIYPNPVQNDLTIDFSTTYSNALVEIVNMRGQVLFNGKYFDGNKINLNVAQLSSGIYIININADNKVLSKRLIKQ